MKVTFNIDCTPAEARAFFGLPDVAPMQEKLMEDMQKKMQDNMKSMDPESMMNTWMPMAIQNWTEFQKMFWGQLGQQPADSSKAKKSK